MAAESRYPATEWFFTLPGRRAIEVPEPRLLIQVSAVELPARPQALWVERLDCGFLTQSRLYLWAEHGHLPEVGGWW